MPRRAPFDPALEAALAGPAGPSTGRYVHDLASGRWDWSDEVYTMYGFEPGEVVPTTALMLAHEHADDPVRIDQVIEHTRRTGGPFGTVHRIEDARGRTRVLTAVGLGRRDAATGEVVQMVGYVVDVTAEQQRVAQEAATRSIREAARHRAGIEQAKGMLMAVCALDEEGAFARLRRASNLANVPLRDVATWLVGWFARPGPRAEALTARAVEDFLAAPVPPGAGRAG
jgi:PAS domain S-box-containing protein